MTQDPHHLQRTPTSALNLRRLVWLRTIAIPGAAIALLLAGRFYNLPIRVAPLADHHLRAGTGQFLDAGGDCRRPAPSPTAEFFTADADRRDGADRHPLLQRWRHQSLRLPVPAAPGHQRHGAAHGATPGRWPASRLSPTPSCSSTGCRCRRSSQPGARSPSFTVHVIGMWLGFVLSAVLIAHFVVSMGETLREQERSLSEARERALRDERVVAVATLAAGAAHELSTPLATMAVVTPNWPRNTRATVPEAAREPRSSCAARCASARNPCRSSRRPPGRGAPRPRGRMRVDASSGTPSARCAACAPGRVIIGAHRWRAPGAARSSSSAR